MPCVPCARDAQLGCCQAVCPGAGRSWGAAMKSGWERQGCQCQCAGVGVAESECQAGGRQCGDGEGRRRCPTWAQAGHNSGYPCSGRQRHHVLSDGGAGRLRMGRGAGGNRAPPPMPEPPLHCVNPTPPLASPPNNLQAAAFAEPHCPPPCGDILTCLPPCRLPQERRGVEQPRRMLPAAGQVRKGAAGCADCTHTGPKIRQGEASPARTCHLCQQNVLHTRAVT